MSKKVFIIGNPGAGKKKLKSVLPRFTDYLISEQIAFSFEETRLEGEHPVSDLRPGEFSDLVILGGDGTLNEAVNALSIDIPVGIIPTGTGNDFAKNINIGQNRQAQFETAVHGKIISVDLGVCNGRKFLNGVGIGFDGQIVEDMAVKRVPILKGFAAYYYHVLRILAGYREKSFDYRLDEVGRKKDLILLTIGNGTTFGGGFKLTPQAFINDGLLDVCEIGKMSSAARFLNINRLSKGSHDRHSAVRFYQCQSVHVDANPALFAHIDGERMGQPPFEIGVLPEALKLRVQHD